VEARILTLGSSLKHASRSEDLHDGVTSGKDAYQSAYFHCKLDGDKVPSARAIRTLVQGWKEMKGWFKRTSAK